MNKLKFYLFISVFFTLNLKLLLGQSNFILLVVPEADTVVTTSSTYRLSGSTLQQSKLFLNRKSIQVYSSGAFAGLLKLNYGENKFELVSENLNGRKIKKDFYVFRKDMRLKTTPWDSLRIENRLMLPDKNMLLDAGDILTVRIKGTPDCKATFLNGMKMHELSLRRTGGILGIYEATYKVKESDTLTNKRIKFVLTNALGDSVVKFSNVEISMLPKEFPRVGITKGFRPYLNYGLGTNRLGGAKLSIINPGIELNIIGKVGTHYKVKLSKNNIVWKPEKFIDLLPVGTSPAKSLTGMMNVYGDTKFDYVTLSLRKKLPYASHVKVKPTKIIVDVFGAASNTNWLVNSNTAEEIKKVYYRQPSQGVFRIIIKTIHPQLWGYKIYYNYNKLVIRIKRKPKDLDIDALTFVIDPGHGGSNKGAVGSTGMLEKTVTLSIAEKLKALLEDEGATVYLTRNKDVYVSSSDRIRKILEINPDILISIHANSIGLTTDPRLTKGTTTFYKYIEYAPLATAIFKRMAETGLRPDGYVGSFNFSLNSLTEMPNALVETAFISNPEDEIKLMNDDFRETIAEKIYNGIEDFLDYSEDN